MTGSAGGAADARPITFDAERCVRASDKYAACAQCVAACPTAALHANGSVAFKPKACVNCGLCLHLCPTGAFSGDDGVNQLIGCASRLGRVQQIELACARHPSAAQGPRESASVIVTSGCLAALGASAYLALLAGGSGRVLARLDACADCPQGKAGESIERTLGVARALGGAVEALRSADREGWTTRTVILAAQPALSRRDFLRTFAAHGQALAAQALAAGDDEPAASGKRPPRERRRLLNTLRQLPGQGERQVDAPPFGTVAVHATCSACGACARACPTGALQLRQTGRTFRLSFAAAHCTACGVCVDVCEPQALRLERGTSLGQLLAARPDVVWEGAVRDCMRCGAKFASASDMHLCPACDFRQRHPFGSRMPARKAAPR